MKKLLMMALLAVVYSARVPAADLADIRESTRELKREFAKLVKLRGEFSKLPENERKKQKTTYQLQAEGLLATVEEQHRRLDRVISDYLKGLGTTERLSIEAELESTLESIRSQINMLDQSFRQGDVTESLKTAEPVMGDALDQIDRVVKRPNPSSATTPIDSPKSGEADYMPYFLSLFLLLFGGVTIFWIWTQLRQVEQVVSQQVDALKNLQANFSNNTDQVQELQQRIEYEAKAVWRDFNEQRDIDLEHQNKIFNDLRAELRQRQPVVQQNAARGQATGPAAVRTWEERVEYTPRTPANVYVSEYLNRVGGQGILVKSVLMRPDVLQLADGDGLYLVLPIDGQHNRYEVIPGISRFSGAQDFSHFSYFYDCEQPAAGEVIILEPAQAIYNDAAGQWVLQRKGRLQMG